LLDRSRVENDAEHSWEMATMVLVLSEYFDQKTNFSHVIKMLLLHDLVEIYAGDSYAYDCNAIANQQEREVLAADRLFGLLPTAQKEEFRELWEEFEARQTNEAQVARAIDRFQPLMHSYLTGGKTWKEHNVKANAVRNLMSVIGEASHALGEVAEKMISDAVNRGFLNTSETT